MLHTLASIVLNVIGLLGTILTCLQLAIHGTWSSGQFPSTLQLINSICLSKNCLQGKYGRLTIYKTLLELFTLHISKTELSQTFLIQLSICSFSPCLLAFLQNGMYYSCDFRRFFLRSSQLFQAPLLFWKALSYLKIKSVIVQLLLSFFCPSGYQLPACHGHCS